MNQEVTSILVLVAIFADRHAAADQHGRCSASPPRSCVGSAVGVSEDDIFAGFPGDLFIILVGVTYLFAIANNNGTVDWLVHAAVRAVGGRVALIPWVMFAHHRGADRGRLGRPGARSRSSPRSRSASPSATGSTRC